MRRALRALLILPLVASMFIGLAGCSAPGPAYAWRCIALEPGGTDDLTIPAKLAQVRRWQSVGGTCISIVIPVYQDSLTSTYVGPGWNTPSDATIAALVHFMNGLRLKAVFTLHNESYDGAWRARINPQGADRAAWWSNELGLMVHYGRLAQQLNVPMYTLGTEMIGVASDLSASGNGQFWRATVIPAVKRVYSGLLTYDANWGGNPYAEEAAHISFWGALNGPIMISAYYPISSAASWSAIWTQKLAPLVAKWHRPIMYGELGYWPVLGTGAHPWQREPAGTYSEPTQSYLYGWALQSISDHQPTLVGVSFWSLSEGSPQGRLAEKVIAQNWNGTVPSTR